MNTALRFLFKAAVFPFAMAEEAYIWLAKRSKRTP